MAQVEKIGASKKKAVAPKQPAQAPRRRPAIKKQTTIPENAPEPEQPLTAEQWEKKFAEEAAETARQEAERQKQEAERQKNEARRPMTREEFLASMDKQVEDLAMTKEQWVAKLAAEKQQPKTFTREEFLAQKAKQPAAAQAVAPKQSSFLKSLLSGGSGPKGPMSPSEARVRGMMQGAGEMVGMQPVGTEMPAAAPVSSVEEVESVSGLLANMKENPIVAGGVTFVGLLILLVGLYLVNAIAGLVTEIIGFVLFAFGLIYVFGHIKTMFRR